MFQKRELNSLRLKIKEFIEAPSQHIDLEKGTEEEIQKIMTQRRQGAVNLANYMKQSNGQYISQVLTTHEHIPTSYLFSDLAVKISEYTKTLELLFDICKRRLLSSGLHDAFDLERFANAIPSRVNAIYEYIRADEEILQRMLDSFEARPEVLKRIKKQYPVLGFEEEINRVNQPVVSC